MASTLDLLDDELDQINLELEDDGVSGSRFAGRSKKGKRKRKQSSSPAKSSGDVSAPNSAPSSPENPEDLAAAAAEMAAAVAAEVPEAMAEVDDADDELGDEYDEIELDDEEAAQRVAYEVDQVGEEDNDGDDDDDAGAEKDEAFEVDTSDSDDSEDEEVRHRVKKSKGDYGSDDEANARKDAKHAKKAPATTKERMLQLRQENQRLRKSVPIDFGERKEEEGAKISLFNLLHDLKQKQPQKEEAADEEEDEQAIEEVALLDKMVDMCETVAAPTPESQQQSDQADGEDAADAEEAQSENEGEESTADDSTDTAAEQSSAEPPSADQPDSSAVTQEEFDPNWLGGELNLRIGDAVRVQGLKAAAQHNGKEARVADYDPNMGGTARYTVTLLDDGQRISVRPVNLEVLDSSSATVPSPAAEGSAAPTEAPTTQPAPVITDDLKARIERNRQIAMAKREARRLSQQQAVASSDAGGMGAFFQSSPPALASLNYDVPAAQPAAGTVAPDPVSAELNFEEELAKAVEAAEATMPAPSAGSQDEQSEVDNTNAPAPSADGQLPESLPFEDVSEPQDAAPPSADDMNTDNDLNIDAAKGGSAAPAPAPVEGQAEKEQEDEDGKEEEPDFIVADEWEGERPGYYFGTGPEGPGYLIDRNAPGDVVPEFQTGVLTETLTKWVLGGREEPDAEKVKLLEPHGWLQAGAEGGFETQLTREQFRAVGEALRKVRSTTSKQEEKAQQTVDDQDEDEDGEDENGYETADEDSAQQREEDERVENEMEIELEDAKTGQKWSPFQPKANSRQQLRAKQQEKIFLKRAERARKMKELGLVPDHNAEMGPSLEPDDRDDDFDPYQEDENDQENEQAIDDILQNDLAEVEADAEVPVDPEADEADYETIEDDTLPMEDDDEPEVELTEEEKAAKAEADALKAARLEEERIKREEEERKQREREAIQRRKEQILELRKMALEDRAARKAQRHNARNGLLEGEADESGSDFSDDDDEESAERQAIEELRGVDYLVANDKDDENTEAHRSMLAKQVAGDMESYLKQRGDVFDDDGKIIRHGRAMRKLLRKAQEENEEDAVAQQLANQSDSDSSDSSDSDDDDGAASNSGLTGATAAGGVATGSAAAADGGTSRAFAFASNGGAAAALEPTTSADASSAASGDGLTEKQRKKLRKKNIKRMRRAELARNRSTSSVGAVDVKMMEEEVTNMIARSTSRSQSALTKDSPRRRPMLQRRNTYTRDASGLDSGTSQSGASAFGSIKAGVSKGFFATQQKKPEGGGGGGGSSMDMTGAMSASDLNEQGETVVAAADGGFTPFSGATLKRTKSFGGGAAAAVRANLRRQQSLKQGRAVGLLDALGGSSLSRAATIG